MQNKAPTVRVQALLGIPAELAGMPLADLAANFAVTPKAFSPGERVETINPCRVENDTVWVPIHAGFAWLRKLGADYRLVDELERGGRLHAPRMPNPHHPSAPPGQADFFAATVTALETNYTALAVAQTGSGKTVCALNAAAALGVNLLALVPTHAIAEQWAAEAVKHLGLSPDEVFVVSKGAFPPEGDKIKVCVAVIHNVLKPTAPRKFFRRFALTVWDECHKWGARWFSSSLALFPSIYRLALTATPERADGTWTLIENQFGPPAVVAEGDSLPTECWAINTPRYSMPWVPQDPTRVALALTRVTERNIWLNHWIQFLYNAGRRFVVQSASIGHLQSLHALALRAGIATEEMAFYTGGVYEKRKGGKNRLKKFSPEHFKQIKQSDTLRIVFGTYAMMKEAVDIPWLDAGLEATPLGNNTQGIGRARRRLAGKKKPIWLSPVDVHISYLYALARKRFSAFRAAGIEIIQK